MRANSPFRHRHRARLIVGTAASILLLTSAVGVATAVPEKTYTLSISPVSLVAGATYPTATRPALVLTVTNTSPQPQQLGSMNLTVPTGITATSVSGSQGTATIAVSPAQQVIQLRNLGLPQGQAMTVTIGADVECASAHAPYTWASQAKQSNDFNGVGNDLTLSGNPPTNTIVGTCQLFFTGQPRDAIRNATVTTVTYDPAGAPVAVTVATGDSTSNDVIPVTWGSWTIGLTETGPGGFTPTSVVTASTASGAGAARTAVFAPALDAVGPYTLVAGVIPTDPAVAGATSDAFIVVDVAVPCGSGVPCSSGPQDGTRSTVEVSTASANGGFATVAFNPSGTENMCQSGSTGTDVFDVNVTASSANKTVKITIARAFVTKAANKYNVCVRLSHPFTTAGGAAAEPVAGGFEGNLPDCTSSTGPVPCVASRAVVRGDVEIVFLLAPGDPPGKAW